MGTPISLWPFPSGLSVLHALDDIRFLGDKMRAPGQIEPIIYFKNVSGKLMLAAYSSQPTPDGWMREEADTLPLARDLERRLQSQDHDEAEREGIRDQMATMARRQAVRDALMARIHSSAATEYEKEFLRYYIQLSNEKCALYEQRWLERTTYLHALHYDTPKGREVDSEEVNVERLEIK